MNEFETDFENRIVSASFTDFDPDPQTKEELSLRPQTLSDYTGQEKTKELLKVSIEAAKLRGEPLEHVLLYGPPGLGKTTLSHVIANEMGANIKVTSGPAIEKAGDLAAILSQLSAGDVLFIDEIHRLSRAIEEILYSAMEDFVIDIMMGQGQGAHSIQIPLEKFTLIGATTRSGALSAPLRDRFGHSFRLEMYTHEELSRIVSRSAGILNIPIEKEGAFEIARRSRGTPRIANRVLRRVRDFAQVRGDGVIDTSIARQALEKLEIDELGLDQTDRQILTSIIKNYNGGPVGLETLSATIGEEAVTIEDVYEPYLLQIGFLSRTPRGRCATVNAYRHLGFDYAGSNQSQLSMEGV